MKGIDNTNNRERKIHIISHKFTRLVWFCETQINMLFNLVAQICFKETNTKRNIFKQRQLGKLSYLSVGYFVDSRTKYLSVFVLGSWTSVYTCTYRHLLMLGVPFLNTCSDNLLFSPSEEFKLTANSLAAHIETHGKLILRPLSYLSVN